MLTLSSKELLYGCFFLFCFPRHLKEQLNTYLWLGFNGIAFVKSLWELPLVHIWWLTEWGPPTNTKLWESLGWGEAIPKALLSFLPLCSWPFSVAAGFIIPSFGMLWINLGEGISSYCSLKGRKKCLRTKRGNCKVFLLSLICWVSYTDIIVLWEGAFPSLYLLPLVQWI